MASGSPYKEDAKTRRRNMLIVPLLSVPLAVTGYLAYGMEKSTGPTFFHLHPLLMLTSFLSVSGISILTKKIGGRDNTMLHGYLMGLAGLVAGIGGYVMYSIKEHYGKQHLTTPHAQVGAVVLCGIISYPLVSYILYNPDNGLFKAKPLFRKLHNYSGKALVALGLVSCCFGVAQMEKNEVKLGGLIFSMLALTPFLFF